MNGPTEVKAAILIRFAKEFYPEIARFLTGKLGKGVQVGYKADALRIKEKLDDCIKKGDSDWRHAVTDLIRARISVQSVAEFEKVLSAFG